MLTIDILSLKTFNLHRLQTTTSVEKASVDPVLKFTLYAWKPFPGIHNEKGLLFCIPIKHLSGCDLILWFCVYSFCIDLSRGRFTTENEVLGSIRS